MSFRQFRTAVDLQGYVDAIWINNPGGTGDSVVLPDGCVEIVIVPEGSFALIELKGRTTRGRQRAQVLGLGTRPHQTRYVDCEQVIGVRLTPAGALRIFGDDLRHVLDRSIDASVLRPILTRNLCDSVCALIEDGSTDDIDRVLRAAIANARHIDARDELAATLIHRSAGRTPVGGLAMHAGFSTRQLDRRFERCFGIGPKLLSRITRFRNAFELGTSGRRGDWASVAARSGYADQAHLVREFVEFAGQTPEEARRMVARPPDV